MNTYEKTMYTKREIRGELRRQLKKYESSVDDLKPDERKALHEWVEDGNSVYDNAYWLAGEDGNPLCYIAADRLAEDMANYSEDYGF